MNFFYIVIITIVNTMCVGLVLGTTAQFHKSLEDFLSIISAHTKEIAKLKEQLENKNEQ